MPEKLLGINYPKSTYSRTRKGGTKGRGFQTFRIVILYIKGPKLRNNGHFGQYFKNDTVPKKYPKYIHFVRLRLYVFVFSILALKLRVFGLNCVIFNQQKVVVKWLAEYKDLCFVPTCESNCIEIKVVPVVQ